jgi:polyribonucleotide nucleotidyltransferase
MTIKIKKEQIGMVIGPAGKNINAIREATGTEITIEEDGTVYITGRDGGAEKAHAMIAEMTYEYKAGDMFKGEVIKIVDFRSIRKNK